MAASQYYIRQRAPLATDDSTQLYFAGCTWEDEVNSRLYRMDSHIPLNAIWTDITTGGGGPPDAHKASHVSGGADALASSDLLEAVIKRLRTSTGPTDLLIGAVADGEYLRRSGTALVGGSPSGVEDNTPTWTVTTTASTNYTVLSTDCVIILTSASAVTVNLPTAVGVTGKVYFVKRMGAGLAVTIDANGTETVDGVATYLLAAQYQAATLVSDGSNWLVV